MVRLLMFSKMLQEYSIPQLGELVAGLGFDGVDLTVRSGGHIAPADVERKLPDAVERLRGCGLDVGMLTTEIKTPDEPWTEPIFDAAAAEGIRFLKLGYWRYRGFGQLDAQIAEVRVWLDGIAMLAEKYGITATIHTHSGDYLSATAGVLRRLLDGYAPHLLGAYIDPRHMTVEGSAGGWKQGLDMLAPWITLVGVKSAGWFHEDGRWSIKNMSLRAGAVRWPEVLDCLKATGYDGYLSFHSEYAGRDSWRDLNTSELVEQTRADLAYLRPLLAERGMLAK